MTRKHGFNIVGRVRALAARFEWATNAVEREQVSLALQEIDRILAEAGHADTQFDSPSPYATKGATDQ